MFRSTDQSRIFFRNFCTIFEMISGRRATLSEDISRDYPHRVRFFISETIQSTLYVSLNLPPYRGVRSRASNVIAQNGKFLAQPVAENMITDPTKVFPSHNARGRASPSALIQFVCSPKRNFTRTPSHTDTGNASINPFLSVSAINNDKNRRYPR